MLTCDEINDLRKNNGEDDRAESYIEMTCRNSYGNHYVVMFCQRLCLKDIYDHSDPGYMTPKDIHTKRTPLPQIYMSYSLAYNNMA